MNDDDDDENNETVGDVGLCAPPIARTLLGALLGGTAVCD